MRVVARRRVDPTGRYSFAGLPPGLYLVAALPASATADYPDRRLFESVAPLAKLVTVAEGRPATADLVVVQRPR